MPQGESKLEQHLNASLYGVPELKAVEKRKYLGTFRERVYLTIKVTQLSTDWLPVFEKEIVKSADRLVLINGNLDDRLIRPYLRVAAQHQVNFTLKTGSEYQITPESLAIVITASTAVNLAEVDIAKLYPNNVSQADHPHKNSLWDRLHHRKE
ncbi:YueI family protein [Lactobacillus alvi]|uniref:YueI family protein n=1 Tax=Limosilactobacillus alvi TaxID=990412 RepID=A0ABS2ELJ7_9LACO|nr:YueI family protein [Limosilactobacillus alvi]MBM6753324.1 YueI family protein [Limosilactobacillus alvi]